MHLEELGSAPKGPATLSSENKKQRGTITEEIVQRARLKRQRRDKCVHCRDVLTQSGGPGRRGRSGKEAVVNRRNQSSAPLRIDDLLCSAVSFVKDHLLPPSINAQVETERGKEKMMIKSDTLR